MTYLARESSLGVWNGRVSPVVEEETNHHFFPSIGGVPERSDLGHVSVVGVGGWVGGWMNE